MVRLRRQCVSVVVLVLLQFDTRFKWHISLLNILLVISASITQFRSQKILFTDGRRSAYVIVHMYTDVGQLCNIFKNSRKAFIVWPPS